MDISIEVPTTVLHNDPNSTTTTINYLNLDQDIGTTKRGHHRRSVFLDGTQNFGTNFTLETNQIEPTTSLAKDQNKLKKTIKNQECKVNSTIYRVLQPMFTLLRVLGVVPVDVTRKPPHIFRVQPIWMLHSVLIFLIILMMVIYMRWWHLIVPVILDSTDSGDGNGEEGRFEEAVIDYLFTIYLVPIVLNPIMWYESRKQAKSIRDWIRFEMIYGRIARKQLKIEMTLCQTNISKPILVTACVPIISCAIMVITNMTMVNFQLYQLIPYCYINTVIYTLGGIWYLQCEAIGHIATIISDDFKMTLKNIGPSGMIADYRALWLMLSKMAQEIGTALTYALIFLCLYLFLVITLTIYGLLSQIQSGLNFKDIGLVITALSAIILLYFVCDEAHYATTCVRTKFQKQLLLVELSWMNAEAQQEINMFIRATEMNPTEISLGGYFDVNRNLFKGLLATMVTYLVVLLQFQISIPTDISDGILHLMDNHTNPIPNP